MTALVLMLLAQSSQVIAQQGRGIDGGTSWAVNCTNCSGGGSGASWFPDGGYIGSVSVPSGVTADLRDAGVNVLNFPATQAVSGTVTVQQSTAANLNATVTGTVAATQSGTWNVATVSNPVTVSQATAANLNATVTGTVAATQSGTWTDRIVGNAGGVLDAANNAAAPANVLVQGFEAQSSALGASATAGNVRRAVVGLDGVQYVRAGGPLLFSGGLTAIAATLTQVVAAPAAGTSLYVTDITAVSDTATAGQMTLRYGTGTNCGTGTTTLWPNVAAITAGKYPYPANTAANPSIYNFATPLKVPAANALCVICVATNTCTITVQGYTAP